VGLPTAAARRCGPPPTKTEIHRGREAIVSGSGSPRRPGPRLRRPVGGSYTPVAMEAPPLDLVCPVGPGGCRVGSSLSLRRGRVAPARSDEDVPSQMLLSERGDGRGAGGSGGEMGERG
jgi:hypothetical protein